MFHAILVVDGPLDDGTRGSLQYGSHRLVTHRSDSIKLHYTVLHSLLSFSSSPPISSYQDVRTHRPLGFGSECAEAWNSSCPRSGPFALHLQRCHTMIMANKAP
ncbi:hypothetical protein CLIM01_11788 [Colletotrichum limetticola]|uniref:Uncharacterized protein n=1 Tax=Colletotrichum limetticola TaxID=1209924 RepID=A0ABQ9PFL7_9PEZI|nr:hypothetical protein CLIM01_11788 [Colletotrichum limetticola]